MKSPRTIEEWRERLDSVQPQWRRAIVEDSESFPATWSMVTGDSRATAYRTRRKAEEIMEHELAEILEGYRRGEISLSIARTLLRSYVKDEWKDAEYILPVREGRPSGRLFLVGEGDDERQEWLQSLIALAQVQNCTPDDAA